MQKMFLQKDGSYVYKAILNQIGTFKAQVYQQAHKNQMVSKFHYQYLLNEEEQPDGSCTHFFETRSRTHARTYRAEKCL